MDRRQLLSLGYKTLGALLVLYALVWGLLSPLPQLNEGILGQSSRNIFYHVPMWFATIVLMGISLYHSIRLLRLLDPDLTPSVSPLAVDIQAREAAKIGVIFNILGLGTGMVWSRVAWAPQSGGAEFSSWWVWDPIQVCALIALLIYLAYFLLRSSFAEPSQRARVAAVYNIFAFAALIPLFFIIPRMYEGLHPTAGKGSFVFDKSQISNEFRAVLYPGMLGFILLGIWMFELRSRIELAARRMQERQSLHEFNRSAAS
ncbi:MAG: cytochrome c biogenesis protein CcsA [Bacteroidia bacterium]|nr:cytochrome c biogenesis protein CcsA [Bacteroidia bacterium]